MTKYVKMPLTEEERKTVETIKKALNIKTTTKVIRKGLAVLKIAIEKMIKT